MANRNDECLADFHMRTVLHTETLDSYKGRKSIRPTCSQIILKYKIQLGWQYETR